MRVPIFNFLSRVAGRSCEIDWVRTGFEMGWGEGMKSCGFVFVVDVFDDCMYTNRYDGFGTMEQHEKCQLLFINMFLQC